VDLYERMAGDDAKADWPFLGFLTSRAVVNFCSCRTMNATNAPLKTGVSVPDLT